MRWLIVALAMTTACKGKPKHRPPPANLAVNDPTKKPTQSTPAEAPDIVLPHGNGQPPKKTTAPIELKTLLAMQTTTYKGFQNQPHAINPERGTETTYITEDRPRIAATITIAPCSDKSVLGACVPLQLPLWQAMKPQLMKMVPAELHKPGTQFEIGTAKFHDTDIIYTFQLGQTSGTREGSAGPQQYVAYTYAYTIYYNDGVNQIRVLSEYKDDAMELEKMTINVTRSDLANTANAFFDAMTQLW